MLRQNYERCLFMVPVTHSSLIFMPRGGAADGISKMILSQRCQQDNGLCSNIEKVDFVETEGNSSFAYFLRQKGVADVSAVIKIAGYITRKSVKFVRRLVFEEFSVLRELENECLISHDTLNNRDSKKGK